MDSMKLKNQTEVSTRNDIYPGPLVINTSNENSELAWSLNCNGKSAQETYQDLESTYMNDLNTKMDERYVYGHPGVSGQDLGEKIDETIGWKNDKNHDISKVFRSLHGLLQYKNQRYGNSGLEPINVFSKAEGDTGLLLRLDDKIARIKNSPELRKNDVADVVGYLVLLCVKKGWSNFDEFKD